MRKYTLDATQKELKDGVIDEATLRKDLERCNSERIERARAKAGALAAAALRCNSERIESQSLAPLGVKLPSG